MRILIKLCKLEAPNALARSSLISSTRRKPVTEFSITIGPEASATATMRGGYGDTALNLDGIGSLTRLSFCGVYGISFTGSRHRGMSNRAKFRAGYDRAPFRVERVLASARDIEQQETTHDAEVL